MALSAALILALGCADSGGSGGENDNAICGNDICEEGETKYTCAEDCGCGNGLVNEDEECDGTNLDGETCSSLGYSGGTLRCTDACTFDTVSCGGAVCGDGVIEGLEACEGNDLAGNTCISLGYDGGLLACSDTCEYDVSGCTGAGCGDGVKDDGEDCDGDDLGGTECIDLSFSGGTLSCNADCTYNTDECITPTECGDGVVEGGEECDDSGESATCNDDCTTAECGDGVLNNTAGEDCDGGGETVDCNSDCTPAECGDGVLNTTAGEECDGAGETVDCNVDCTSAECGDGVLNTTANEECDDGNTADCDGCTSQCIEEVCGDGVVDCGEDCDDGGETAACDSDCTTPECGDGVRNSTAGEECDDGNTVDGDGCDSTCMWEGGAVEEVLLIPDSTDDKVSMFDPQTGDYLADFIAAGAVAEISTPINAVQAANGNVFVSDQIADSIFEFASDGTYIGVFADDTDNIDNLRGIDFYNGDLYVSDGGNDVIAVFDDTGTRLADYINDGSTAFDVLFLSDGRMALTNMGSSDDLRLYDAGGGSYTSLLTVTFPEQVSLTPSGTFLVASFNDDTITEVDDTGTVINQHTLTSGIRGVYVLGNGNWLATSSSGGDGVFEVDPATGSVLSTKLSGAGWRFIEKAMVPSGIVP